MSTEETTQAQLIGQPAELRMTVEITRAATGLKEVYELTGTVEPEPEPEPKEVL